jgi:hypothetical protein
MACKAAIENASDGRMLARSRMADFFASLLLGIVTVSVAGSAVSWVRERRIRRFRRAQRITDRLERRSQVGNPRGRHR